MKFTASRESLLAAVTIAAKVLERGSIPILDNLHIKVGPKHVTIEGTDMDILVSVPVKDAQVGQVGETTANGKSLLKLIGTFAKDGPVGIEGSKGNPMTLLAGKAKASCSTIDAADFPTLKDFRKGDDAFLRISAADLLAVLNTVFYAISSEITRYYLNGIYLHQIDDQMFAVTTDGHRMARRRVPVASLTGKNDLAVIIPRKAITLLRSFLAKQKGDATLQFWNDYGTATVGDITMTFKLIDGPFPDYQRIIPPDADKVLTVDTKTFTEVLTRVSSIGSRDNRAVKISLGKSVILSARNMDGDEMTEELEEVTYSGVPFEIDFNAAFLLDMLARVSEPEVNFHFQDNEGPGKIVTGDTIQIIMPMRI